MDDFPLSLYVKCINLSTIMVCDILDEIICIAKISAVEWRHIRLLSPLSF